MLSHRCSWQLFYALEVKEQQLEQAMQDKESLEQEVLTARQLSARGGGGDPKFIEIHHHNDISVIRRAQWNKSDEGGQLNFLPQPGVFLLFWYSLLRRTTKTTTQRRPRLPKCRS